MYPGKSQKKYMCQHIFFFISQNESLLALEFVFNLKIDFSKENMTL